MDTLVLQYNPWFIAMCLLAGLVYASILYYKKGHFEDKSKWLAAGLFLVRFVTVSIISFLLLSPLFKTTVEQRSNPVILIGQDFTASLQNAYTGDQLQEIKSSVKSLKKQLGDKYDVREYSIGGDVKPGFKDSFDLKSTDLSSFFKYINESYDNSELAAVLLSTDGIYNQGVNPLYVEKKFNAPVYTLALGDTTVKKDLMIDFVYFNDLVFLGDKSGIKVEIKAKNAKGEKAKAQLFEINKDGSKTLIDTKDININSDDFFTGILFVVEPRQTGIMHYKIVLTGLKDEDSYANNQKDIFIEVIDSRVKILIYANNPHPDIGAYKDLLLKNKNYEVDIEYAGREPKLQGYDLIIYFNLPSKSADIENMHREAVRSNISELFITGTSTGIAKVKEYTGLFEMESTTTSFNEVQAKVNESYDLFITSELIDKGLENFPPLIAPFGDFKAAPDAAVLLYQRINKIDTKYPLIALSTSTKRKTGVILGVNFYKWRLYEYLQYGNTDMCSALAGNIVQYLTVKKDKSQWRVHAAKNVFFDTEDITFKAGLYNDSYQLLNTPEAYMKIINNGKEYDYVFSREDNYYVLNTGNFPAGDYRYIATVKYNGTPYTKKGKFKVIAKDLEKFDLVARHDILYKLANMTGGKMIYPENLSTFVDDIKSKDIKPVIYYSEKTSKLLDLKWVFWLLLFLLTLEWFVRRYNGSF